MCVEPTTQLADRNKPLRFTLNMNYFNLLSEPKI